MYANAVFGISLGPGTETWLVVIGHSNRTSHITEFLMFFMHYARVTAHAQYMQTKGTTMSGGVSINIQLREQHGG